MLTGLAVGCGFTALGLSPTTVGTSVLMTFPRFSVVGVNLGFGNLSEGQKKLVDLSIIVTFIDFKLKMFGQHTNLLILDEVLSVGDVLFQKKIHIMLLLN